jgi:hypothetical protein
MQLLNISETVPLCQHEIIGLTPGTERFSIMAQVQDAHCLGPSDSLEHSTISDLRFSTNF